MNALLRHDPQARRFEHGIDLASQVTVGGIGLDDRERAGYGHRDVPLFGFGARKTTRTLIIPVKIPGAG
jgi:hypothetical protein